MRAPRHVGTVLLAACLVASSADAADEGLGLRQSAERLAADGRCGEAIDRARRARELAPGDAQAAAIEGRCAIELERHDGLSDNSLEALAASEAAIDAMLARLATVNADELVGDPAWITHAYLLEQLEASVGLRVCRTELWNVNQMGGWHLGATQVAQLQPVGTPELRQQSLARWTAFAGFVDQEIENLVNGLDLGYSAPKAVCVLVMRATRPSRPSSTMATKIAIAAFSNWSFIAASTA